MRTHHHADFRIERARASACLPAKGCERTVGAAVAARRELLERLPFADGYGVEIAMLIGAWRAVGLERMAQVDLGVMEHEHQPLQALTDMAETVLRTIVAAA